MGLTEDAERYQAQLQAESDQKAARKNSKVLAVDALLQEFATEMRRRSVPTFPIYEERSRDILFTTGNATRTVWAGAEVGRGWRVISRHDNSDGVNVTEYLLFEDGQLSYRSMNRRKVFLGFKGGQSVPCVGVPINDVREWVDIDHLKEGLMHLLSGRP